MSWHYSKKWIIVVIRQFDWNQMCQIFAYIWPKSFLILLNYRIEHVDELMADPSRTEGDEDDEDDENIEDNWRNDYPDEDEDELLYE